MRPKAYRRHQTNRHMWRRLKEDRNQHYNDLTCLCWTDKKVIARFKEQPQHCSLSCCGNPRKWEKQKLTFQERKMNVCSIYDW